MRDADSKGNMSKILSQCNINSFKEMSIAFYGISMKLYIRYINHIFEEIGIQEYKKDDINTRLTPNPQNKESEGIFGVNKPSDKNILSSMI